MKNEYTANSAYTSDISEEDVLVEILSDEENILAEILSAHENGAGGWKITDDNSADWALAAMETAQKNIGGALERKKQLMNKIERWFENTTQTDFITVERMEYFLTEYVKERGKRKLIGGTVYLQKSPAKILAENADLELLHTIHPDLVRIKLELNKQAAKELLQSAEDGLLDFGIELKEGGQTLRIKK